jgi:hypothetical protein
MRHRQWREAHGTGSLALPRELMDQIARLCEQLGITRAQLIAEALEDLEIGRLAQSNVFRHAIGDHLIRESAPNRGPARVIYCR